jgi:alkanesulfonate monooxygenase SsuD/methylene tetrahydromethanopterin reductase-like flavin-dependent oxidoreductase (luciferase family)
MAAPLRLGAHMWNQNTDWPAMRAAAVHADALGYDSLWTWDHLYPIVGSDDGPIFEGWLTLAAWAAATSHAHIGLMVGANTLRNPALVAKMATTLDHISAGRAVLGIGAAWFETEHTAYGIEFGNSPGERLRWLDEAVQIMGGMLRGDRPSGTSHYAAREVLNEPSPVQARLPLLIGGGGEKVTLRIVARHADACNFAGGFENVRHKDEILRRHCAEVGRDESEIERTAGVGVCIIRDNEADARRVATGMLEHHGRAKRFPNELIGTPEQVAEKLAPYLEIGFRHLNAAFPAPHDTESMERLVREVGPVLDGT